MASAPSTERPRRLPRASYTRASPLNLQVSKAAKERNQDDDRVPLPNGCAGKLLMDLEVNRAAQTAVVGPGEPPIARSGFKPASASLRTRH